MTSSKTVEYNGKPAIQYELAGSTYAVIKVEGPDRALEVWRYSNQWFLVGKILYDGSPLMSVSRTALKQAVCTLAVMVMGAEGDPQTRAVRLLDMPWANGLRDLIADAPPMYLPGVGPATRRYITDVDTVTRTVTYSERQPEPEPRRYVLTPDDARIARATRDETLKYGRSLAPAWEEKRDQADVPLWQDTWYTVRYDSIVVWRNDPVKVTPLDLMPREMREEYEKKPRPVEIKKRRVIDLE
jgi:hypothetical protein